MKSKRNETGFKSLVVNSVYTRVFSKIFSIFPLYVDDVTLADAKINFLGSTLDRTIFIQKLHSIVSDDGKRNGREEGKSTRTRRKESYATIAMQYGRDENQG